jgi:hypothetical protein
MITDYYYKTGKKGVKGTVTEQDYTNRTERLKITPTLQENEDKEQHQRATTSHRKSNSKGATDRLRLYHNRKPRPR